VSKNISKGNNWMIIILGVAGSGKSTQSQLLVDRLGMNWVSTGELCRRVVTGKRREEMLAGKVLDQDEVIDILDAELKRLDNKNEIILDGFPRGLKQVAWLLHQEKIGRLKLYTCTQICQKLKTEC
jgi:adenylate kinase family enzyme